eukprot:gene11878-biopygen1864
MLPHAARTGCVGRCPAADRGCAWNTVNQGKYGGSEVTYDGQADVCMSMESRCDGGSWTGNGPPAARAVLPVLDCARAPRRPHAVRGLRHAMGGGILSHFAAGPMRFGRGRDTCIRCRKQ